MEQAASFFYTYYLNMTGVTADDLNQLNSPTNTPPDSLIPVITDPSHAITVPDPYTVQFHLGGPFPDLTAWLSRSVIVDPRAVELHGGVQAGQPNSWVALNPIGTGPFMLESFVQGSSAVLVPNPNYWGGPGHGVFPKPKLSKVVIRFVPAETTRELDITSGSMQVAAIDMDRLPSVTGSPGLVLPDIGVSLTWSYLLLNPHLPPMDNILVREAIVHAINGEQINQTVYHGLLHPSLGVVPYPLLGHVTDLTQYSYDPDLSKSLLAQAGYPDGRGLPPITFVYATDYSRFPK
jgi:ABC-type transport system substrate-binding protein